MKNQIITISLCLCVAASFAQDAGERANQNTPNDCGNNCGYLLPEVTVLEEVIPNILTDDEMDARADDFQKLDMRLFVVRLEKQIAINDKAITAIKD